MCAINLLRMPFKCVVFGCRSNYDKKTKGKKPLGREPLKKVSESVKMFKLQESWKECLPPRMNDDGTRYQYAATSYICCHHWTGYPDIPMRPIRGPSKTAPRDPPDNFPNVSPTCIPKPKKQRLPSGIDTNQLETHCRRDQLPGVKLIAKELRKKISKTNISTRWNGESSLVTIFRCFRRYIDSVI